MEIKITKKQNVIVDGVKYKAVLDGTSCGGCKDCAFDTPEMQEPCRKAPCELNLRNDSRDVIFIKSDSSFIAWVAASAPMQGK